MKRHGLNLIVAITLGFAPFETFSQEKFLSIDEVHFATDIERSTLETMLLDQGELIDGFMVIVPEDSMDYQQWRNRYASEMARLKERKVPKKLTKDVENIYNRLHETFLRKYEYVAFFDQLFKTGTYNCVTAVALYAMAFDDLGIPYNIKETPAHVYIVADPDNSQLLIETTDPVSGFQKFTPGFREQFVAQLGLMKLVNEDDIASKGIYGVFDEIYFGGDVLSLKELVGIQYYNLGFTQFDERDYRAAWNSLGKAQLFHSTDQIDQLLFASLVNLIAGSNYSEWEDIALLPYLERFETHELKKADIIGEFNRMLSIVLVSNNDEQLARRAFDHFVANSTDEEIKRDVSFNYYYERTVIAYNRGYYDEALDYVAKAYDIKPGNAWAENLLIDAFANHYQNKNAQAGLKKLDTLLVHLPDLENNNRVSRMRLNLCLVAMGDSFEEKMPSEGDVYKNIFENAMIDDPEAYFDEDICGNAYSKAAVYYFKRGYTSKARAMIKTGLKYAPNSYELKTRLRMISN